MTVNVYHKHSVVKDKAPDAKQVELGEIAINANQDSPALYIKDSADQIRQVGGDISAIIKEIQEIHELIEKLNEILPNPIDGSTNLLQLLAELGDLKAQVELNAKCCTDAHITLETHQEHLEAIDVEIEELKKALALLQIDDDKDIKDLEARVAALEASLSQLAIDVNKIDQEQEQIKADLAAEITDRTDGDVALSNRIDVLEAKTITAGEGITVTVTASDTLVEIDQDWLEAYLEAYLKKNIAGNLPPIA